MANLVKWVQGMPKPTRPKDQPLSPHAQTLHPDEKRALFKLKREARQNGASLHSKGEGGLPPSLVLGVMRRDQFACVECHEQQDLQVHHRSTQVPKTLKNRQENVLTICAACHNKVHKEADRRGVDPKNALHGGA